MSEKITAENIRLDEDTPGRFLATLGGQHIGHIDRDRRGGLHVYDDEGNWAGDVGGGVLIDAVEALAAELRFRAK